MKTIIKKINIYKFEELEKEVQEKVIEKYFNDIGCDDNNNLFQEFAKEIIEQVGFKDVEVNYSLSYCQGDGICFDFKMDIIEVMEMLENIKKKVYKEKGYKRLETLVDKLSEVISGIKTIDINNNISIYTNKNSCGYYYSRKNTRYIDFESNNISDKLFDYIEKHILPLLKNMYDVVCDTLEEWGYSDIYYKPTKEEMEETSFCNEWEYYEDGELY
jgi:hypothetical protein